MIQVDDKDLQKKVEKVYQAGQGHIFHFWDSLNAGQRDNLLKQIEMIDFDLLRRLIDQALEPQAEKQDQSLQPPDVIDLQTRKGEDDKARQIGEKAIAAGKVAAFLVAGGQGTRLGFDAPKGMYPVTPVKKKSLFQLHAEKIRAIGRKSKVEIPWYIMTSMTNYEQTKSYFEDNAYFGMDADNVFLFVQEMIPAIDRQGKLILDGPDHIFMNPNGHGGSIRAVWKSGALADMKARGVDYIFYFQVDNVLTRICDPVYFGYHIMGKSEMSCKVVHKKYPEEKIGILCRTGDKLHLIEYSDLDKEYMYAKNPDGSMKFWVGNIATHIFDRRFLERENKGGFRLPWHIALKSIPYINQQGDLIKPEDKNGIKFETFVFDALVDARRTTCVEVERKQEFSPLKNSEGENSPQTTRHDLIDLYSQWLEKAGFEIERDNDRLPLYTIEISPLISLEGENLAGRVDKISDDLYIG